MEVSQKLLAAAATLLAGGSFSGWSVAITKSDDAATANHRAEQQRASLVWARENGMLYTLAELPYVCVEQGVCEGTGCPDLICSADQFCDSCRCVGAPDGHCVPRATR